MDGILHLDWDMTGLTLLVGINADFRHINVCQQFSKTAEEEADCDITDTLCSDFLTLTRAGSWPNLDPG